MLAREHATRPAEAGGDFVADQQHLVRIAQVAQHPQINGVVKAHAARALHDRFDDDRGEGAGVRGDGPVERLDVRLVGCRVETRRRFVGEDLPGQDVGEQVMHAADRVTHRHRAERVAVIAAADGEHPGLAWQAGGLPVLHRHLQGDFDTDRARVGEEHVPQRCQG